MRRFLLCIALAALCALSAFPEVPVRAEQFIWSVIAANGRDYSPTFVPESSPVVSLIAGTDNFLSARKTLLYWWPITSDWKTDTESLNVLFTGTLEIRDDAGRLRSLSLENYTYFNIKGDYEQNWKVLKGEAAVAEIKKYEQLYQDYFTASEKYQVDVAAFDSMVSQMVASIQKLKDEGKDYSAQLARMQGLKRPTQPAVPTFYTVAPAGLQQGFIVNLPRGHYSMAFRNADGTIMEGSEKGLVVEVPRRSGGTGYELMPSDKWTRAEESLTPASVIYVNGVADLYVRPFFENEYNDLGYQRTVNNQAGGNPSIYKWVRIQQVPHATIVLGSPGSAGIALTEQPYYVEQSAGSSLGYSIIPWDPQGPYKDQGANLIAFRVPVEKGKTSFTVRALGSDGTALPGSARTVRVVAPLARPAVLVVFALMPLLLMVMVLILRRRGYAADRGGPGR
jgi:hypothetical protein